MTNGANCSGKPSHQHSAVILPISFIPEDPDIIGGCIMVEYPPWRKELEILTINDAEHLDNRWRQRSPSQAATDTGDPSSRCRRRLRPAIRHVGRLRHETIAVVA